MANKVKKISALSIIIMLVGGTIGAGIFYKNKELLDLAQGKFGIVLATWGVGIVGMMALGLSLIELTSAQKTDRGVLDWTSTFTPKWFHKSSSNFTKWFFLPIMFFGIPIYVTQSLEEVGVPISSSWIALFISVAIFLWFMITNLISLRFAEVSQWIFTFIQTIPLIILPIVGFMHWGQVEGAATIMDKSTIVSKPDGLNGISPYMAFIAGIGSIAFAYNGFYAASSLRNQMEKPKQLGAAQSIGIAIVSFIYLFVSFGFNIAGNGTHEGLTKFIDPRIFKGLRICIVVGIVAIINNLAMSSPHQMGDLANSGDSREVKWIQRKLFQDKFNANTNNQKYISGWIWILVTTLILFFTLGVLGSTVYTATGDSKLGGRDIYGFSSIALNFTALIIFAIITTAILGGLINRKTKKVETEKSKWFIPSAIIAVIINYIGLTYAIVAEIVNVTGFNNANVSTSAINLGIYAGVIFASIIPAIISTTLENKKLSKATS